MSIYDFFKNPKGLVELPPEKVKEIVENGKKDYILIDVRTNWEYNKGHIKGSLLYTLGNEDKLIKKLGIKDNVILICKTGHRSRAAANRLIRMGFNKVYHIKGGMDNWRKKGLPEEK